MIDSHCHLDIEPLYENINDVILRSKNIGISKLLTICTNLESFENIKKIINIDPIIYGTFGVHPHDADIISAGGHALQELTTGADMTQALATVEQPMTPAGKSRSEQRR